MKKICTCCGQEKNLDDFYKHKQMLDGHLNKCKECKKSYQLKYRFENIEVVKEYDRNRPNAKERSKKNADRIRNNLEKYNKHKEDLRNWNKRNRNKRNAHLKVKRAIIKGIIKKPNNCQKCGRKLELQAHHSDYEKPLDVIFLCIKCHNDEHKRIRNEIRHNKFN